MAIIHDIATQRYEVGNTLTLDVDNLDGVNEAACILSRETWPAGECVNVIMLATIDGRQVSVLKSDGILGGDAPLDDLQFDMEQAGQRTAAIDAAKTELARRWQRSITAWRWEQARTIEREADGKPAYRVRGTEQTKEVQYVTDDEGREREIAWNPLRPTAVRFEIEFLQTLRTSIRVEVL